ncbi:hypothetical protein DPMN_155298, partial [Dreissena polymorpha]
MNVKVQVAVYSLLGNASSADFDINPHWDLSRPFTNGAPGSHGTSQIPIYTPGWRGASMGLIFCSETSSAPIFGRTHTDSSTTVCNPTGITKKGRSWQPLCKYIFVTVVVVVVVVV